jgi:hypothetical protein
MRLDTRGREIYLGFILLLGVMPATAFGTEVHFQSDTIIQSFESTLKGVDGSVNKDSVNVLPVYEYLRLDAGQLTDYGISYHMYGWGRADLDNNGYFGDQTAGELLYGYVEYKQQANRFDAKLGRQHIFEGVSNVDVDGVRVGGDLGDYFSLSLYGGQPVVYNSVNGGVGDSIFGGRLANRLNGRYELGVSYKTVDNDSDLAEQKVGVDLSLDLPANMSLYTNSAYNLITEGWGEQTYELRIPIANVLLKPNYVHFSYLDYFGIGDIHAANPKVAINPFQNLAKLGDELTASGLDALWKINDQWTVGGKAKFYDYKESDQAQTFSALATWKGANKLELGGELGRTNSDDEGVNEYTLVRLYGIQDALADRYWIDFVSSDLLVAFYDKDIYGQDKSVTVSLGGGKRFIKDSLSIKVSADYSKDPYYDHDLRGMVTMSYVYDHK